MPSARSAARSLLLLALALASASRVAADTAAARLDLDVNGDGVLDDVRLTAGGLMVTIPPRVLRLPVHGETLASADVDCDGRCDVVVDDGRVWVPNERLCGAVPGQPDRNGDGLPFPVIWETAGIYLENTTRHIVGDFDADGRPDLVVADYTGEYPDDVATITMFERTGATDWQPVWSFSDGPRAFSAFATGDTDRDGLTELIVGRSGGVYADTPYAGPRVYVFESDANNSLVLDHLLEVDPSPGLAAFALMDDLVVGDANDDGAVDIVVGLADNETLATPTAGSRIHVFTYCEAAGMYASDFTHTQTNISSFYLTAIDVGDADNDGHAEVVWFERIIPRVYQAKHINGAFVVDTLESGIEAGLCMDVNVTDLNHDGSSELLCGGASDGDGHIYVLESDGAESYAVAFIDDAGIDNTVLYVDTDDQLPPYVAASAFSQQVYVTRHLGGAIPYPTLALLEIADAVQCHEVTIGPFVPGAGVGLVVTRFNGSSASGGYEVRVSPAGFCPGDADCSGYVDWRDIDFFVAAQNDDVSAWTAMFLPGEPSCPFANNDVNDDGSVNWRDIDPFVTIQNTVCP